MSAILPGGTVGIFGGGQLGRMLAMAARPLGYSVVALDPDASCAARFVLNRCWTASFEDTAAAAEMARSASVVTVEIEKVALASLEAAALHAPVRPGAAVLGVIQDRGAQRRWLAAHGFPQGPWREGPTSEALVAAVADLGGHCFVKACRDGYDGRGQARTRAPAEAARAWTEVGGVPCVAEKALELEAECSVLVARRPGGECAVYPPALNHHVEGVLAWSVLPGPLPPAIAFRATEIARAIAESLAIEGLLVVEMFLTRGGELLVNELAPRPHNSFHSTEIACVVSQFEQAVRAICDLPLGSTDVVRPTAICNLLGDLWEGGRTLPVDRALELPGVRLNLYGKRAARPGR